MNPIVAFILVLRLNGWKHSDIEKRFGWTHFRTEYNYCEEEMFPRD